MKRAIFGLILFFVIFIPLQAVAHPLGKEWFGQRADLKIYPDHIEYSYVLEIPTTTLLREISDFQIKHGIKDFDKEASDSFNRYMLDYLRNGIELYFNGKRFGWQPDPNFKNSSGEGELNFFEYRLKLYAHLPEKRSGITQELEIVNKNYEDKKSVYLNGLIAEKGVKVAESNIPKKMDWSEDYTYRKIKVQFELDPDYKIVTTLGSESETAGQDRLKDKISELLYYKEPTFAFIALALGTAFLLGAAHAFSPGHGKALISAYLVGSQGRYAHAILLGVIVTITHTGSVFLLGLLFLIFPETLVPENAMPYIGIVSGSIIFLIGIYMFYNRWSEARGAHHHHHNHRIKKTDGGFKSLLAMGLSGGMVPCPSAMALMLVAISVGKVAWGMILVSVYSLGLAVVLIILGILAVGAIDIFKKIRVAGKAWKWLPIISSILIAVIGISIFIASLEVL